MELINKFNLFILVLVVSSLEQNSLAARFNQNDPVAVVKSPETILMGHVSMIIEDSDDPLGNISVHITYDDRSHASEILDEKDPALFLRAGHSFREVFNLENGEFKNTKNIIRIRYAELARKDPSSFKIEILRAPLTSNGSAVTVRGSARHFKGRLQKGDRAFVPVSWVHPLQSVISYYGVGVNLYLKANRNQAWPELKENDHQSIASLDGAKEAVIGVDHEIYLLDGHHTFTASLLAGAVTFPVRIVENYSDKNMSQEEWIRLLEAKEQVYLTDLLTGERASLKRDFAALEDSPLRTWVDASGAEIPSTMDAKNRMVRAEIRNPAWIRDANSVVPFVEFKLARILVEEGLTPDSCPACFRNAPQLSDAVNEQIRKYLTRAEDKGRLRELTGVRVIRDKIDITTDAIEQIDLKSLNTTFCGQYDKVQVYGSFLEW